MSSSVIGWTVMDGNSRCGDEFVHDRAMDFVVPFQRPQLPKAEHIESYFARSRDAHWFSNEGPCVRLLCDRLNQYVGNQAVAVSSGTLGLMVALRAATGGASRGQEVIVPSFTYIASVSAILWTGLTPVFVDVAPGHWQLDPEALHAALEQREDRVAAVLACSTFGCAPPRTVCDAWEEACRDADVPLLVDSAAGFGSRDELGQPLGRQGVAEVFSFHATKPLAAGEGGAVFAADQSLVERIAGQTRFGLDARRTLSDEPGLNAKMSEIHAATALAALDDFEHVLNARSRRSTAIRAELTAHGFESQLGCDSSAWQFVPLLAPSSTVREDILRAARLGGVQLRTYHQPLHAMPRLSHYETNGDLAVTRDLATRTISLPLANDLTDDEISRIRMVLIEPARELVR
jgi:dTDP-4-amino-4,6-dideoxygalactose transaminase